MLRDNLVEANAEIRSVKRQSYLLKNKIDFAKKVTEQRMALILPSVALDHDELASLYSSLIDEDMFEFKDGAIAEYDGFLKDVEDKVKEDANADIGQENLKTIKHKILEKVKGKKVERRQRRDSISSVKSNSSNQGIKRRTSEELGRDTVRKREEHVIKPSAIPLMSSKQ